MRYWFTNEAPADPLVFSCDYALVTCNNITAKFVTLSSPVNKATMYLEIGFTAAAGSLAPGQSSGEIQTRVHHVNWSNFITTDSYSFISDESFVYKDTQTVTLYLKRVPGLGHRAVLKPGAELTGLATPGGPPSPGGPPGRRRRRWGGPPWRTTSPRCGRRGRGTRARSGWR